MPESSSFTCGYQFTSSTKLAPAAPAEFSTESKPFFLFPPTALKLQICYCQVPLLTLEIQYDLQVPLIYTFFLITASNISLALILVLFDTDREEELPDIDEVLGQLFL